MKCGEAIKMIMKEQKVSQMVLAKRTNTNSQQIIGEKLNRENITIKSAKNMVNALGYKIVLMPDTMRTPTDCYEVE